MDYYKNVRFWQLQCFVWLGFALVTRFTWIDTHPPGWLWIGCYMSIGFVVSSGLVGGFALLHQRSTAVKVVAVVLACVVMGLVWRSLFNALEYHVLESANNQYKFWGYFHNGKSAVMQLMIFSAGYWLWHYHLLVVEQQKRQQQLLLDAQKAQLQLLHYQIAPHFLFNVLSNLDTLMLKGQVPQARTMLEKLSDYLRQILLEEPSATRSLADELKRCQQYLDIERSRFADRLTLQWQIPDELPNCQLPAGVLQPLFENAVKYGTLAGQGEGRLDVQVNVEQQRICLTIGNPVGESAGKGFGIGLSNTRQRLQQFFGDSAKLTTTAQPDYFEARLELALA